MTDEYTVTVSRKATEMLVSHAAFLAQVSPNAAERFVSDFEAAASSLSTMPLRCPFLSKPFLPANKYRFLVLDKRYLILYQVREKDVFINYVVDCRQDYSFLL